MKKLILNLILLLGFAFTFGQGFTVNNFTADIVVDKDGWFDITETYDINFSQLKHGIFRDIITKYKLDDKEHRIYISDIDVLGDNFTVTPSFLEKLNGQIQIKIGDKDRTVYGDKTYKIKYRVKNAFLFNEEEVMFYWNVKADVWQADFRNVEINIKFPEEAQLSQNNSFIYSGFYGNETESSNFDLTFNNNILSAKSKEGVIIKGYENVTALVKLPGDMITKVDYSPSAFMKYGWLGILGAIATWFWSIFKKHGKEDKVVPFTSYYPPEGIDPAMAGYLINDREDASDLIALIPKWGQEGYIRIEEIPKKGLLSKADTRIFKLKEIGDDIPDYERTMFNGLFSGHGGMSTESILKVLKSIQETITGNIEVNEDQVDSVLISDLSESFYTTMGIAKSQLKNQAQIFYLQKSNSIMNKSYLFSALGLFLVSGIFLFVFGIIAAVVSVIFFIGLIIFSGYMKKKNPEGNQAFSELLGFKQFVKLAETNRIKTLIKEDPDYFEKTMSYALAFGLLKEWAGKFAALDIRPPEWYGSSSIAGPMTMNNFANSFSSSMNSTQSAMVSTPSSSGGSSGGGGGGFSGGGFGGGGGGSW